jgi:molecular chaperone IbpA
MNARTFDLTPFHRATVGFDRIFDLVDRQFTNSINTGYPPYNIIKVDENTYQIELAVAGFSMEELTITQNGNELLIEGQPTFKEFPDEPHVEWKTNEDPRNYIHKGIANRTFKRSFLLGDHVEVKSADLGLGILAVQLERKIPEEMLPKKIAINSNK